jgi:hypothetical protein
MHDSRVGRFLSVDPLFKAYSWFSPYQFAGNSPISCVDLDGLEMYFAADGSFLGQSKKGGTEIRIATKYTPYKAHKNGKIDEGFVITKSLPLNQFDLKTQGKVYQTIYDKEIGGEAKIVAVENVSPGTGAYTSTPLGEKPINVNVDFYEQMYNPDTEKFEYGIGNRDYYSALANMKHEEHHFKDKIGDNAGFDHMKVWAITWREMKKDGTYSKLSSIHKNYILSVGLGYINDMSYVLSRKNSVPKESFDYYYNLYVENIKVYNSLTGEKIKVNSKEEFMDVRKENGE